MNITIPRLQNIKHNPMVTSGLDSNDPIRLFSVKIPIEDVIERIVQTYQGLFLKKFEVQSLQRVSLVDRKITYLI